MIKHGKLENSWTKWKFLQFYIQYIAGKINEQNLFKLWTFQQATFDCQSATIQLLISKQLGYTGIRSYSHAGVDRMWTYIYIYIYYIHMLSHAEHKNAKMRICLKIPYPIEIRTTCRRFKFLEVRYSWYKLTQARQMIFGSQSQQTSSNRVTMGFFQRPILIQLICQTPP